MARVLAALLALLALACEERESAYASFDDLKRAGDGALSWFPSWTPASATELREWHDIDSNDTFGRFTVDGHAELPPTCRMSRFPENPGRTMHWWPSDAEFGTLEHAVCEERVQFGDGHWETDQIGVAVDRKSRTIFFWRDGFPSRVSHSPPNSRLQPTQPAPAFSRVRYHFACGLRG